MEDNMQTVKTYSMKHLTQVPFSSAAGSHLLLDAKFISAP
jgi:hypothetical protein